MHNCYHATLFRSQLCSVGVPPMPAATPADNAITKIQAQKNSLLKSLETSGRKGKPGSKLSYNSKIHGNKATFDNSDLSIDLRLLKLDVAPNSRVLVSLTMKDSTVRTISFENTAQSGDSIQARIYFDPTTGKLAIAENDSKDKPNKNSAENPGPLSEKFHTRRKGSVFKASDTNIELTGNSSNRFTLATSKPEKTASKAPKFEIPKLDLTKEEKKLIELKELPESKEEQDKLLKELKIIEKKISASLEKINTVLLEQQNNNTNQLRKFSNIEKSHAKIKEKTSQTEANIDVLRKKAIKTQEEIDTIEQKEENISEQDRKANKESIDQLSNLAKSTRKDRFRAFIQNSKNKDLLQNLEAQKKNLIQEETSTSLNIQNLEKQKENLKSQQEVVTSKLSEFIKSE